jgi:hypothetical protein
MTRIDLRSGFRAARDHGRELARHSDSDIAVPVPEQFGQHRALRAEHGVHPNTNAEDYDNDNQHGIAEREEVPRREGRAPPRRT